MHGYKNRAITLSMGLFLICLSLFPTNSFAAVFNVTDSAGLQNALTTAASNGEGDTINVAAGTYSTGGAAFTYNPVSENFALTLDGAGAGTTILDGGNSGGVLLILVSAQGSNADVTIRDVTIRSGNRTDESGAGLFFESFSESISIRNCIFSNNSISPSSNPSSVANGSGAFIRTQSGDITLTNNSFLNNSTRAFEASGGGAFIETDSGDVMVTGNTFSNNSTNSSSMSFNRTGGGGIFVENDSGDVMLTNNTFRNNQADAVGSVTGGGASVQTDSGDVTLTDNTFDTNSVDASGDSSASGGGVFILADSGDITLTDNTFDTNSADISGGIPNSAGGGGARVFTNSGDMALTNNTFIGNFANSSMSDAFAGGAGVSVGSGDMALTNNTFIGNFTNGSRISDVGGAFVSATDGGEITVTNNTLTLNSAGNNGNGGGLFALNFNSSLNIYNNIIFNNSATQEGDDIFVSDRGSGTTGSPVNLFNNDFSDFFSLCEIDTNCTPDISQGNNINQAPLFVDAANGDVHLRTGSPAINAGTASAPALPVTDFEGQPRVVGGRPDMGADETVFTITCNGIRTTIVGTRGNDIINGTPGRDIINSLGGNDRVNGLGGNDVICGSLGNDILNGGLGQDLLLGEVGNDMLNGGLGNDILRGGGGNDRLFGQVGSDTLSGDLGLDMLNGGDGNDTLNGNTGNDTMNGNAGNDTLNGGTGNDALNGGFGVDTCNGGPPASGDTAAGCENITGIP